MYEAYAAEMLTSSDGILWKERKTATDGTHSTEWSDLNLKLSGPVLGLFPIFIDMVPDTLYFPLNEKFPAVEFFYKSVDDKLIGFQVTRQGKLRKIVKSSAYRDFLKRMSLEDPSKVILKLIPIPSLASVSSIEFTLAKGEVEFVMPTEVFVVQVPLKYGDKE